LQQYNHARAYGTNTRARGRIKLITWQSTVDQKIEAYNQVVSGINSCLQAMQLYEHLLPVLGTLPGISDSISFSLSQKLSNSAQMV